MEYVFYNYDLLNLISERLDFKSWYNLRLTCLTINSLLSKHGKKRTKRIRYASEAETEWKFEDYRYCISLPEIFISPSKPPCFKQCQYNLPLKRRLCGNKPLKNSYCCKRHQEKEWNINELNQPKTYYVCACSACRQYDKDFEKAFFEKNMNSKHCCFCWCITCVCELRRINNQYDQQEETCYWDGPCMGTCVSCIKWK